MRWDEMCWTVVQSRRLANQCSTHRRVERRRQYTQEVVRVHAMHFVGGRNEWCFCWEQRFFFRERAVLMRKGMQGLR